KARYRQLHHTALVGQRRLMGDNPVSNTCSRRAFVKGSFVLGLTGLVGMNRDLLPMPHTAKAVLVPVMLTPFHQDLSLDTYCLGKLIEFYRKSGAGALFANCLSS